MARKDAIEYQELLKDYLERGLALAKKSSTHFQNEMVDPELVEEAKTRYKEITVYYNHLSGILSMATLAQIKIFYSAYAKEKNLNKYIEDTYNKIKEQEPNSPLLAEYEKILFSPESKLGIYSWVQKLLSLPRSKKRRKVWKKKGWWITQDKFLPFIELENRLKSYEEWFNEEF